MQVRIFSATAVGLIGLLIGLGIWGWAARDPAKADFERAAKRRQENQGHLIPTSEFAFDSAYCNVLFQITPYVDPEQPPSALEQQPVADQLRPQFDILVREAPPDLQQAALDLRSAWEQAVASGDEGPLDAGPALAARQALEVYELTSCR